MVELGWRVLEGIYKMLREDLANSQFEKVARACNIGASYRYAAQVLYGSLEGINVLNYVNDILLF